MNNQEAKFILRAYRSNGVDANDALFAEALRQAQQDPVLRTWLASEQALDAAIASKLKDITPPAGLREAILTGAKVSSNRRSFWRQPQWISLGAAAALLITTSIAVWPKRASAESRLLTEFALKDTAGPSHDGHGVEVQALQAMLGNSNLRLREGLAVDFNALRGTGCRTLHVDGREVFEICFNRNGTWFHLYAVRASSGETLSTSEEIEYRERGRFSCASWSDQSSGFRFAVVGTNGMDAVRKLL